MDNDKRSSLPVMLTPGGSMCPGSNVINPFTAVIYKFLYKARVFVRIGWKSLSGTNTPAYYENS